MSDDELIGAMVLEWTAHATPKPFCVHAAMRAVLAVVREHDKGAPTAFANSGPKERNEAFDALKEELSDAQADLAAERERADSAEVREKTWHDAALAAKAERDALLKRVKHTEKLCEQHWLARDEADKRTKAAEAERDALRERVARLVAENGEITDLNQTQFLELEHLRRISDAAHRLYSESEEYDFDDGLGRGAPQELWDALSTEIDTMTDAQRTALEAP
jgi:hypothetical protein